MNKKIKQFVLVFPMKLFMVKMLKCDKCKTDKYMKVNATEIIKTEEELSENKKSAILNAIKRDLYTEDELNAFLGDFKEFTEADGIEFIEGISESEDKMIDLFYRREIVEGSVICVDCGVEKQIKKGILHMI